MIAYYNEIDPYCVQWLRNLIDAKLIAPGTVDDRPIQDVRPSDLIPFTQCHFFAGLGGWSYALRLADIPDHRPLWTGSCPCQPFSTAGQRRGFADERHLWPFWHHLVAQRRPPVILGEQVASASQWLGLVRGDLEALGYAVGAIPIEAASAGANHLRDRYWFVAHGAQQFEREPQYENGTIAWRDAWTDPGGTLCFDVGHSNSTGLAFGSVEEDERRNLWQERSSSTAPGFGSRDMANRTGISRRLSEHAGWQDDSQVGGTSENSHLPNSEREWVRGTGPSETFGTTSRVQGANAERQRLWPDARPVRDAGEYQWVLGADGKARRVGTDFRRLVDGLPDFLARLRPEYYQKVVEVMHAASAQAGPTQILRAMWSGVSSQDDWLPFGRSDHVFAENVLLTILCECARRYEPTRTFGASEEVARLILRGVQLDREFACASHQRRYHDEHAHEHSDALRSLPYSFSQHARATWEAHCRQNAQAIQLLAADVPARVAKLRAFGNAIDPRPAAAFIKAALT